jgi:hypothetical protein
MKLSQQMKNAGSLLDATGAMTNWRAMLLLGATLVVAMLVLSLSVMSHSAFAIFLGGLLFLAILFYGGNAVGVLLMDEVSSEEPSRSIIDAVMASLFSSHRLIVLALIASLAQLVLIIGVAILLFVCKIPLLGPLLLVAVLPLSALLVGLGFFVLGYVYYPMAAAATWSGASIRDTLSQLIAITRQKLVSVVIQQILLLLLVAVIALLIGSVVFSGLGIVGSMATGIVSPGIAQGLSGLLFHSYLGGGMDMDAGSGFAAQLMAMGIGAGLLIAVGLVIPGLIALQGYCQIYRTALQGLDLDSANRLLEEGNRRVREAQTEILRRQEQQRLRRNAADSPSEPAAPSSSPTGQSAPAPVICPACHAPQEETDARFCGDCGHKLR